MQFEGQKYCTGRVGGEDTLERLLSSLARWNLRHEQA